MVSVSTPNKSTAKAISYDRTLCASWRHSQSHSHVGNNDQLQLRRGTCLRRRVQSPVFQQKDPAGDLAGHR